jgi:hypothetical protein
MSGAASGHRGIRPKGSLNSTASHSTGPPSRSSPNVRTAGNEPFSAVGITDSAGRFVLKTFRPNDGAVAGTHIVMIEKSSYDDKTGRVTAHLPRRYARQETSGLTAEVTEKGPNDFTFRLESK